MRIFQTRTVLQYVSNVRYLFTIYKILEPIHFITYVLSNKKCTFANKISENQITGN
jgi:hypothetical protein